MLVTPSSWTLCREQPPAGMAAISQDHLPRFFFFFAYTHPHHALTLFLNLNGAQSESWWLQGESKSINGDATRGQWRLPLPVTAANFPSGSNSSPTSLSDTLDSPSRIPIRYTGLPIPNLLIASAGILSLNDDALSGEHTDDDDDSHFVL